MRRAAALAGILTLSSCTIIGASGGAIAGDHDNQVGRDALIGGVIGGVVDLAVLGIYFFVQSNLTVPK